MRRRDQARLPPGHGDDDQHLLGQPWPNPIAREAAKARNDADTERALAVVAMCVGGMVLARAVDDETTADALRARFRTVCDGAGRLGRSGGLIAGKREGLSRPGRVM